MGQDNVEELARLLCEIRGGHSGFPPPEWDYSLARQIVKAGYSKSPNNGKEEQPSICHNEWHITANDIYAKKHGGAYPRSCPECHSCFNPEPTPTVKVKDICEMPKEKIVDISRLYTQGESNGYNQALEEISNLPVTLPQGAGLRELDEKEVLKVMMDAYHDNKSKNVVIISARNAGKVFNILEYFSNVICSTFGQQRLPVVSVEEIEKCLIIAHGEQYDGVMPQDSRRIKEIYAPAILALLKHGKKEI